MPTTNDIHFDHYMDGVDLALDDLMGCSHLDLPDYDYRACYDAGVPATRCAEKAIRWAGIF
jgi:hypothetical protein